MDQQLVHFIQSNPKIMMGKFQPQAHCAWPDDNPFQRVFHISLRFQPQALRVARRQPVSTGFSCQPAVSTAGAHAALRCAGVGLARAEGQRRRLVAAVLGGRSRYNACQAALRRKVVVKIA